jgi:hypothetical protein
MDRIRIHLIRLSLFASSPCTRYRVGRVTCGLLYTTVHVQYYIVPSILLLQCSYSARIGVSRVRVMRSSTVISRQQVVLQLTVPLECVDIRSKTILEYLSEPSARCFMLQSLDCPSLQLGDRT